MIEARNLKITYGNYTVLDRGDFDLSAGKLVALTGPNGSGKTTLIKTLCGMYPGYKGEIFLNGKNTKHFAQAEIARVVSVVLTRDIAVPLRVFDVVATGRYPYVNRLNMLRRQDEEVIEKFARQMGVYHLLNRTIDQLSDGERQRVMIARALVQETPVLMLDEPDAHLDVAHRASLLDLLRKIADQGKTVLFSTHYLDLFFEKVDQILVLHQKKLYKGAPSDENFLTQMEEIFTNELLIFDKANKQFKFKN